MLVYILDSGPIQPLHPSLPVPSLPPQILVSRCKKKESNKGVEKKRFEYPQQSNSFCWLLR